MSLSIMNFVVHFLTLKKSSGERRQQLLKEVCNSHIRVMLEVSIGSKFPHETLFSIWQSNHAWLLAAMRCIGQLSIVFVATRISLIAFAHVTFSALVFGLVFLSVLLFFSSVLCFKSIATALPCRNNNYASKIFLSTS